MYIQRSLLPVLLLIVPVGTILVPPSVQAVGGPAAVAPVRVEDENAWVPVDYTLKREGDRIVPSTRWKGQIEDVRFYSDEIGPVEVQQVVEDDDPNRFGLLQ
jgi:hypothetical protein